MTELRTMFERHARDWPPQAALAQRFIELIEGHDDCLLRSCLPGHLTGAALITDPALERVLLTHHRKLDKWLQLGGHADGDALLWRVAAREAEEESGLASLCFLEHPCLRDEGGDPLPFDLDIHKIPARRDEPAHLHYDVRYLMVATDVGAPVSVTHESHDVRWFTLAEARALTDEESMRRQFDKLERLSGRSR